MNLKAIQAAHERLAEARLKCEAVRSGFEYDRLVQAWSEFLTEYNRAWTKLVIATNKSGAAGWFTKLRKLRDTDPLLVYLKNARHAEEHGVDPASDALGVQFKLNPAHPSPHAQGNFEGAGEPGFPIRSAHRRTSDGGMDVKFGMLILGAVTVRGQTYRVPVEHLGTPIESRSPHVLATLALDHFEAVLAEASRRASDG